ncbi:hypothetical protein C7M71_007195 [Peterkaempfera bronchialis]|uniref:Uncharacterized protein n=1 Tax=Peterkaempfera bronchialis TaxID=2126346 RepID=A0A345SU52_9ACTN|nr:hypothetical protein C7M71_007195 [Peterkaempfera bronchialis]
MISRGPVALLDDPAPVPHDDAVREGGAADVVGDEQGDPAGGESTERVQDPSSEVVTAAR